MNTIESQLGRPAPADDLADGRQWARNIQARYEAGDRIGVYALKSARAALGLEEPDPAEWAMNAQRTAA